MTADQLQRIAELRKALDDCAKPLGDLNLLREAFDELLAILLEPSETNPMSFVVICRDDSPDEEPSHGPYVLATRQMFGSAEHAQDYAKTIAPSREPMIIEGRWQELRPATWRRRCSTTP